MFIIESGMNNITFRVQGYTKGSMYILGMPGNGWKCIFSCNRCFLSSTLNLNLLHDSYAI